MRSFGYRGKHEKKKTVRLPLSAYLSYMLVATLMFTGVSFSKFATTTTSSDSARVAKFNVTATMADGYLANQTIDLSTAQSAESVSWSFTVKNDSEVAATDTVNIVLPKALPTGVSMYMELEDHDPITLSGPVLNSDGSVTYSCFADIGFDESHTWTLTFIGDPNAVTVQEDIGVTVQVNVEQKD